MKENGEAPVKRKFHVEFGDDDCGDDLSGLGPDVSLLGFDCAPYNDTNYLYSCWEPEPEDDTIFPIAQVGGSSGSSSGGALQLQNRRLSGHRHQRLTRT